VAVNCRVAPDATVGFCGEIETVITGGGGFTVTVVCPDSVGSCTEVAVMVTGVLAVTVGAA